MKLEDIKVGMKVRLLGKHGCSDCYDNIEDWYEDLKNNIFVQQIKKQGFGIVTEITSIGTIWVGNEENGSEWGFRASDLEPYEEISNASIEKSKVALSSVMKFQMVDEYGNTLVEGSLSGIKDLVYDIENGTTIVYFTDGTKKIARTEEGVEFDKEIGLLECLGKKLFGNRDGLLKVIESGKVIKRKKNKPIKETIDNVKISDENVFDRFLKGYKIAINCETEEEAKELFTILKRQGVKWIESEELSIDDTEWVRYEKDTCYDNSERELQFGSSACYERQGYTIVKFKDVL